jgi:molybdopterin-guanine dinucleotide biosynthesis protein B
MREFEVANRPTVHQLIAELYDGVDWVLVEGFKDSDLLKIEVWRAGVGKPARYVEDDFIAAVATDSPDALPAPTGLPVLDLNAPEAVADWLISQGERLEYHVERYV